MPKKTTLGNTVTVGDIFIWTSGPLSGKVGYCCEGDFSNPTKPSTMPYQYSIVILERTCLKLGFTACDRPLPNGGWVFDAGESDDEVKIFGKVD